MKAERRNITITNETVSITLDRAENASKFIEKCILFYIEENEKEYALLEDLNQLEDKVEVLNKNYLQTKDTLNKLVDNLFGREQ
ncbi:hypothetical protein PBV87_11445 [Niameybacter massiliensis]|uniref:Uncharacterized protein n=1 Tax=Holtiella tumoricola TaxID=3018743 RepID=A0AA42DMU4_9FIRM|nr:hypothetical protein [Holtiella tumoricola]MDA3732097.1 hypothetical protein [Holtiella tumoricola]